MADIDELRFCAKYPFSPSGRRCLERLGLDLSQVSDALLEQSANRVRAVAKPADVLREIEGAKEGYLTNSMLTYPVAKVLAALTENRLMLQQFARAEARQAFHFLQHEGEDVVFDLARELLGAARTREGYAVPLLKYLEYVPEGAEWALVNREVQGGRVLLDKTGLAAVLGRYVAEGILRTKVDKKSVPKPFIFFADDLRKEKRSVIDEADFGSVEVHLFPPCIRHIMALLTSGEKAGHMPRFVMSTFAAGIKMPLDDAVALFRSQPNFNEKKTRYYLEHSYGTKASGTKYSVPSCAKMETYGLCYRDVSCQWRHPLVYYAKRKGKKK